MTVRDRDDAALQATAAGLPLDFDALALLLGGAELGELVATGVVEIAAPSPALQAALQRPGQWLFAGEPGRWLHEVLWQKVALFRAVVEAVAAVHRQGRPHLALAPVSVRGTFAAVGNAPVRWQTEVVVGDCDRAVPIEVGERTPLWGPDPALLGDLRRRAFLPPGWQEPESSTLSLLAVCSQQSMVDGRVPVRLEASGTGVPRSHRPGDIVLVQAEAGGARLPLRLEEVRPRGLLASAALAPADLPAAWLAGPFAARLQFVRRTGPGADCHALGLLLLRLLLANDERSGDEVPEVFLRVLRRLEDEPTAVRVVERSLLDRLQQLLASRELRGTCAAPQTLYRAADRAAWRQAVDAGGGRPDLGAWRQLLAIAGRLLSQLPQLAYQGQPAAAGAEPLARVAADLAAVQRRLHVALFTADERDRCIAAASARWGAQVRSERAAAVADGQGGVQARPGSGGFRLRIQRDGDSEAQEQRFAQERVTIGRREVDNLLRLNDPMVSSAHAVIERTAEGWVVFDRASTNGTEVDGIRLPVEVPQPLEDGSVICIRPFRLTFQAPRARLEATLLASPGSSLDLLELLHVAWAEAGPTKAPAAIEGVFAQAREDLGDDELLQQLDVMARPGGEGEAGAIAAASARALAQLSRSLLGPGEFRTVADAQNFAARLARFVETTSQWVERTLELRRALGRHLEIGFVSTQSGRPPVRTAADVRRSALGWSVAGDDPDPSPYFLARYHDELLTILGGLLKGNQQIRRVVRERLDPARLVELAGREAKLRLLVQAAAGSALWKLFVQTFQEVTAGEEHEAELNQILQRALQQRAEPGA
jgi:FHA domain